VLLEGLGQLKNPMTSSGIEPATQLQILATLPSEKEGAGELGGPQS
jgi:hypothetical protein